MTRGQEGNPAKASTASERFLQARGGAIAAERTGMLAHEPMLIHELLGNASNFP